MAYINPKDHFPGRVVHIVTEGGKIDRVFFVANNALDYLCHMNRSTGTSDYLVLSIEPHDFEEVYGPNE